MVQARLSDKYANIASSIVTETAANTLSFSEVLTGISLGVGIGMKIDRIEYIISRATLEEIVANGDQLSVGWSVSNGIGAIDMNDRRVIHSMLISQTLVGAVVSQTHHIQPFVFQFHIPMIVAIPRLYLAIQGTSLASPGNVTSRMHFRYEPLTAAEYVELAEAFVLVG